jgi:hypothetical protein
MADGRSGRKDKIYLLNLSAIDLEVFSFQFSVFRKIKDKKTII